MLYIHVQKSPKSKRLKAQSPQGSCNHGSHGNAVAPDHSKKKELSRFIWAKGFANQGSRKYRHAGSASSLPQVSSLSKQSPLLKECGLTTLETRRLIGDQIEVFKIVNGYENIDRNIFFTVKEERRTRGHGVTLAKKQCRLDIRKFSFSQRTVNEWNRLSADCVGASSVNIFKNKIDIYLRRAGYT